MSSKAKQFLYEWTLIYEWTEVGIVPRMTDTSHTPKWGKNRNKPIHSIVYDVMVDGVKMMSFQGKRGAQACVKYLKAGGKPEAQAFRLYRQSPSQYEKVHGPLRSKP